MNNENCMPIFLLVIINTEVFETSMLDTDFVLHEGKRLESVIATETIATIHSAAYRCLTLCARNKLCKAINLQSNVKENIMCELSTGLSDSNTMTGDAAYNLYIDTSSYVRLAGGDANKGRLEVFRNGAWGTVCDDNFGNADATVVCNQLGDYNGAVSYPGGHIWGPGSGNIVMDEVGCSGSEFQLFDCSFNENHDCQHTDDVAVECHMDTRLVNGDYRQGRLEVYRNGAWGTVCDNNFGDVDAQVVCRHLGRPGGRQLPGNSHSWGQGSGPIHMDEVSCSGNEANIFNCGFSSINSCNHNEDVGVECDHITRLVNGDYRQGRLEVYRNGAWGTVCDNNFDDVDAQVVCRDLGHPGGRQLQGNSHSWGQGSGPIHMSEVSCSGSEANVFNCVFSSTNSCNHNEDVGVECDQNTRLVNGDHRQGRLEVYHNGAWGTVCDNNFDDVDAQVVCRDLGHPGGRQLQGNSHSWGQGSGPIHMNEVSCSGSEADIFTCVFTSTNSCSHNEDVGVECEKHTRLVNGDYRQGRLEVYRNGAWGTVCDDNFEDADAQVVCRDLGHPGGSQLQGNSHSWGPGSGPIHMDEVSCSGNETRIFDCTFSTTNNCNHGEDVGIECSADIRLANGDSTQGRLEVYRNGMWGTVCDDHFETIDAAVACWHLGNQNGGKQYQGGSHSWGPGTGGILMDDVACTGNERNLFNCGFSETHNCGHSEDVGIQCHTDIRLANGNFKQGRLEVYKSGSWGTVCDDHFDNTDATVVCNQLGFTSGGTFHGGGHQWGAGSGNIWMDDVACTGAETSILSCTHTGSHNCGHGEDVAVVCN